MRAQLNRCRLRDMVATMRTRTPPQHHDATDSPCIVDIKPAAVTKLSDAATPKRRSRHRIGCS